MATKKSASNKTTAKKATAKKASAKKPTAKKAATKKPATAKTASKKSAVSAASKPASKKTASAKNAAESNDKKATVTKPIKSTAKKAAAAKPAAKKEPVKSPYGQKFVDAQHERLLQERARYSASERTWQAEADSLLEGREPGDVQFDEESGDGDTLQVERERDLALSSHARSTVEEIDAAIKRLEAGAYGVCVTSGKPIPKERLEAIPWAAERVEYKVAGFRRR